MEFSLFFNQLKINDFYHNNISLLLKNYKSVCENGDDFIQLYELKNILDVVDIFTELHQAYLNCSTDHFEDLYKKLEELGALLESHNISCYSYAYYFYVYLDYIYKHDQALGKRGKGLAHLERPDVMTWMRPTTFDYAEVKKTTFGLDASQANHRGVAFPDYNKFIISDNNLLAYKGHKPYVIIPDTVYRITTSAFQNNKTIKMVILPSSVKVIDEGAFAGCDHLNLIQLSDGITQIPRACFKDCRNLKYVLGGQLTEIAESGFDMCIQLNTLVSHQLIKVSHRAFCGCVHLKETSFISQLSYIGDYAFVQCPLSHVELGPLTYVGSQAFAGCVTLKEVVFNYDIAAFGPSPFEGCTQLQTLTLKSAVSFKLADLGPLPALTHVTLDQVTPYICAQCSSLTTVHVTGDHPILASHAFEGCSLLTSIHFDFNTLSQIEEYACANCEALRDCAIQYMGTYLADYAFYHCSALKDFSFLTGVTHFGAKSLAYTDLSSLDFSTLHIASLGAFALANATFNDHVSLTLDHTTVEAGALHGLHHIETLNIKDITLKPSLLYALFERTREAFINNVTIDHLITDFIAQPSLFKDFKSAHIACAINDTTIPYGLFSDCSYLESVSLEGSIHEIDQEAFKNCFNLKTIDITGSLIKSLLIKDYAFYNTYKYHYLWWDDTSYIGSWAFYHTPLTTLSLKPILHHIGEGAFGACCLTSLEVPFIGREKDSNQPLDYIFKGESLGSRSLDSLITVTMTGSYLPMNAFKEDNHIQEIHLPNLEQLEGTPFSGCMSLKTLTLGSALKDFNAEALSNLTLSHVDISDNPYFVAEDNAIYSQDKSMLYYALKGQYDSLNVKTYKSWSVNNYSETELILKNGVSVDSHAFAIPQVKTIKLEAMASLEQDAFRECDALSIIELSAENLTAYPALFSIQKSTLSLTRVVLDHLDLVQITQLFDQLTSAQIDELHLNDCVIHTNTLQGLTIGRLYLKNCLGQLHLDHNVNHLILEGSGSYASLCQGDNTFESFTCYQTSLKAEELCGLIAQHIILKDVSLMGENTFKDVTCDSIAIYHLDTLEQGAFYHSHIHKKIEIYDSTYHAQDNIIYQGDTLYYYHPQEHQVHIPSFIKTVGRHALDGEAMTTLYMPNGLHWEKEAIYNCFQLVKVMASRSNLVYLAEVFSATPSLKEIYFNDTAVPSRYLAHLPSVERIYLNEHITSIGDFAFAQDEHLEHIYNIEQATTYGHMAFMNCLSLNRLILNSQAQTIGLHIVAGCSHLEYLTMPLLDYYDKLHLNYQDILGEISTLDTHLTLTISQGNIPSYMFKGCPYQLILLKSPASMGAEAFKGAHLPAVLNLDSCEKIGREAFADSLGLKELTLSSQLNDLGEQALQGVMLSSLTINNNPRYTIDNHCLLDDNNLIYYIPLSSQEDLVIHKPLKSIKQGAFSHCLHLKSITLDKVETIETLSFQGCSSLKQCDVGHRPTFCEKGMFQDCSHLESLSLYQVKQGSIQTLAEYFTEGLPLSLTSLTLKTAILTDGDLSEDNHLTHITLSDDVKTIPVGYFSHCLELEDFHLPQDCQEILAEAFNGCSKLTHLTGCESLLTLGDRALAHTGIKEITLCSPLHYLGYHVFEGTPLEIISLNNPIDHFSCDYYGIGDTLKEIDFKHVSFASQAFMNMTHLTKITVEQYAGDVLPQGCFKNCSELTAFNCPQTYHYIEKEAFQNCGSLTEINLGPHIHVEPQVFAGCHQIKTLISESPQDHFTLKDWGFNPLDTKLESITLNNITLGEGAFKDYATIKEVIIKTPQDLIPTECFKNCSALEQVDIASFKGISSEAFKDCSSLASFDFKDCVEIHQEAFTHCLSLKELVFPTTIQTIDKAFKGCKNLEKISFKGPINNFNGEAYGIDSSNHIKKVTFNEVTFAPRAFEDWTSLKHIELHNKTIDIPDRAFKGCSHLILDKTLCAKIVSLGKEALSRCSALEELAFPSIQTLGAYALRHCSHLKSCSLGDAVKIIPQGLWNHCLELTHVSLGSNIERIEKEALADTHLSEIVFPKTLQYVGSYLFKGNHQSVTVSLSKDTVTTSWDPEWLQGLAIKHSVLRFLNPKVKIKINR